jgi:hypothetical protein
VKYKITKEKEEKEEKAKDNSFHSPPLLLNISYSQK